MRSFLDCQKHHVRVVLAAIIVCGFAKPALSEKIVIRSGTIGTTPLSPGSLWTQAHGFVSTKANALVYFTKFSLPFDAGFNLACQSSSRHRDVFLSYQCGRLERSRQGHHSEVMEPHII